MFKSPVCYKIYCALYSKSGIVERIVLLTYRSKFKKIDLEKENEIMEELARQQHETCSLPMNIIDAASNKVDFTIGFDVESMIASNSNKESFPIEEVTIESIKGTEWFKAFTEDTNAIEDVISVREEGVQIPHKVDYIILIHDPILGVVRLIDGNHKLAEAVLDGKKKVKICCLPRGAETAFLMPESRKLIETIYQLFGKRPQ